MRVAVIMTLAMSVGIVALLGACAGSGGPTKVTNSPDAVQDVTRVASLSEAQSLLPFHMALPSVLPAGTSRTPELSVVHDGDGRPYLLEAMYWEEESTAPDVLALRMRITETSGDSVLSDTVDFEVVDIQGAVVQFAIMPFGGENAEVVAAWSREGTGYQAEFLWLTGDKTTKGEVTDEMRADALAVLESMIQ